MTAALETVLQKTKFVTLVTATALTIKVLTATWKTDLHQPDETPHISEILRSGNAIRIPAVPVWSEADDYQLLQRFNTALIS